MNLRALLSSIYKTLKKNDCLLDRVAQKWNNKGVELDKDEIKVACVQANMLTNSIKLRSFHYRAIQGALVTNMHLQHYGMLESNHCTFCKKFPETHKHLLFECEKINELISWLFTNAHCDPSFKMLLLSNFPTKVWSTVSLLMKHYIYVSRCKGEDISLNCFCRVLKHYKSLEYEAAVAKDKVSMHMRKMAKYRVSNWWLV